MRTVFVLSGGGAKGGFQAGVIESLARAGVRGDRWLGVSVGALNSSLAALGRIDDLVRIWETVEERDVYRRTGHLRAGLRVLSGHTGLYDNTPLYDLILRVLGTHTVSPALVGRVNLKTRGFVLSPATPRAVFTSATMPVWWDAVDDVWVDGGLREQTPLSYAVDDDADRIIVVLTAPVERKYDGWTLDGRKGLDRFLTVLGRTVEIMSHEIYVNDIRETIRINQLVGQAASQGVTLYRDDGTPYRHVDLYVVQPPEPLGETLDFRRETLDYRLQLGRQVGQLFIESGQVTP